MEGKVTIRGVDWEFHQHDGLFCCGTLDPVNIGGTRDDGVGGYLGGFDTLGEAIEVAVGISARTHPDETGGLFPDEVCDA